MRMARGVCPLAALFPILTPLVACSGQYPSDSAAGRAEGVASLSEELRLDVRSLSVGAVAEAPDGRVALALPVDVEVRVYSASGAPLRRLGGGGEGVTPISSVSGMGWIADTLWVVDTRAGHIVFVPPGEEPSRTSPLPSEVRAAPAEGTGMPNFLRTSVRGLSSQGFQVSVLDYVVASESSTVGVPVTYLDNRVVARVVNGVVEAVIGLVPKNVGTVRLSLGVVPLPIRNTPLLAVASDGARVAVVTPVLEGEDAGRFTLHAMDARGDTLISRSYPFDAVPLPPAVGDSLIAEIAASLERSSGDAEFASGYHAAATVPPLYPPFDALLIGDDHSVWLQERLRSERRDYLVVSPEGDVLGRVELPTSGRVAAAAADRAWVVETDAEGVRSVVRYSVSWSGPLPPAR